MLRCLFSLVFLEGDVLKWQLSDRSSIFLKAALWPSGRFDLLDFRLA